MKISALLLIASVAVAHAQSTEWRTYMLQVPLAGGVGIPERVTDAGSKPSLPLGIKGSRFELWGYKLLDGVVSSTDFLAVTEAGVYNPEIRDFSISTDDPFLTFPRTRVDMPFVLNIDISGLWPESPTSPIASQMVLVEHHADLFVEGNFDGTQIESTKLVDSFMINTNGMHNITFDRTQIDLSGIDKWQTRAGKERFIVYALADGDVPQRVITGQGVLTLPITTGKINGIVDDGVYKSIPPFTCDVHRIYPDGEVWVEVYEGAYSDNKRGTHLQNGGYTTGGRQWSQNHVLLEYDNFSDNEQPSSAGAHTFVLRASTPFAGERFEEGGVVLDKVTTSFSNTISVRSMISTSE